MEPTLLVVALGGNALQKVGTPATSEAQLKVIKKTCEYIAQLKCRGYKLVIVHGNGPQVGRIVMALESSANVTPPMPLDVCGAMSQSYIGYHIQQSLRNALLKVNKQIPVVTIVTQVIVDKDDIAFNNPTKPIGPFYTKEEAENFEIEKGYIMKEDSGRGFRRVVASPVPKKIVEFSTIERLLDTTICITAGGGGIPVTLAKDGSLKGIEAVIDKDLAAEKLAEDINANILLILTEVEKVSINYNKSNQEDLNHITVLEAQKYMKEGHFAPGSMLPKIIAAISFAKSNPSHKAIITSLYSAIDALDGKTGTVITLNK
ncbi:carbamate kinase [Clostridium psychrophilum]|uniref:carbamate kinase n=1 Tax=Clostridium psychrophilum TaxID=132926 RepID=UPI001C0AACB2|nr:carbamate kinase [Clostridium psychrophilum]MBU3180846.1 carbamate kinase [Clostridium psychrophilum]